MSYLNQTKTNNHINLSTFDANDHIFPVMSSSLHVLNNTIRILQYVIAQLGYRPQIHFELEGCYQIHNTKAKNVRLNFAKLNQCLRQLNIEGEVIHEYWRNQWEYVSLFNGQSPLKEAMNLHQVITHLPRLFRKIYREIGDVDTLIQPVVWSGDQGKLAAGSTQIFSDDTRDVHIPNAIQLNVSVLDKAGKNLIAEECFGHYLQYCFLKTSYECSLLYLPEESAFKRLLLKSHYGLAQELCSPVDISGGHQGSVALYQKIGKHNQIMGEEPILFDKYNKALTVQHNWQKTARIEHRLGAASLSYNPYVNVIYGLLNIIDAIEVYQKNQLICVPTFTPRALPQSLFTHEKKPSNLGAVEIFQASSWFSSRLNTAQEKYNTMKQNSPFDYPILLGEKVKEIILNRYQINTTVKDNL